VSAREAVLERGGEPGALRMRLTLVWLRSDGAWRVLAAHAGPAAD
jgi:ketosteroid isomerase-like protein